MSNENGSGASTSDGTKPKKTRKVRAIFVMLPAEAKVGELVRIVPCEKKKDARKVLKDSGIDVTNYADQVKLLRGEYIPVKVDTQVVMKF